VSTLCEKARQHTTLRWPCAHAGKAMPGPRWHPLSSASSISRMAVRGLIIEVLVPASQPCSDGTAEQRNSDNAVEVR
jgi:hypothetical protein